MNLKKKVTVLPSSSNTFMALIPSLQSAQEGNLFKNVIAAKHTQNKTILISYGK